MAKERHFEFLLYRLNVADADADLFEQDRPSMVGDDTAVVQVLEASASPDFSFENRTKRALHQWDVRNFTQYREPVNGSSQIVGITLARSVMEEQSDVVTDTGIEQGTSQSVPPRADHIDLFFNMERHLVAVERFTLLTDSGVWLKALQDILEQASRQTGFRGRIELEPVPKEEEILTAFRSFERLTRLRVWLRLPNPELSRFAQSLYTDMEEGDVREYLADMRNQKGLNKEEGKLPHAAAEVAQAGYKKGTVKLEGVRNGRADKVETGGKAARGTPTVSRDYVRGMRETATTKETKRVLDSILGEMDRVAPQPDGKASAHKSSTEAS